MKPGHKFSRKNARTHRLMALFNRDKAKAVHTLVDGLPLCNAHKGFDERTRVIFDAEISASAPECVGCNDGTARRDQRG